MENPYTITTELNGRQISETLLADPFVTHKVTVSLLDLLKSLLRGQLVLRIRINGPWELMGVVLRISERFEPQNVERHSHQEKSGASSGQNSEQAVSCESREASKVSGRACSQKETEEKDPLWHCPFDSTRLEPHGEIDRYCTSCERTWFVTKLYGYEEPTLQMRSRKVRLTKWPIEEGDNINDVIKPA